MKQMHLDIAPRAIIALGEDLVRDDGAALEELVKNSYDADARSVKVQIEVDQDGKATALRIIDNGSGMSIDEVEHRWLVVATAGKVNQQRSARGRVVTGEKGIGRLATARLGARLEMVTRRRGGPPLVLTLDWAKLSTVKRLADFPIAVSEDEARAKALLEGQHGTALRITALHREWQVAGNESTDLDEIENVLSRIMNPFAHGSGMSLSVATISPSGQVDHQRDIETSPLLDEPHYRLVGHVDSDGNVDAEYVGPKKTKRRIRGPSPDVEAIAVKSCGEFHFDLRAWDRDQDVLGKTTAALNMTLDAGREILDRQTGFFVYRDEFLAVPKKEDDRDWLALDRRRVNNPSQYLGVKNILAAAFISRETNPGLRDKTDRGGLLDSAASREFRVALMAVLHLLEVQRNRDKPPMGPARTEPQQGLQITTLVKQAHQLEKGQISAKQFRESVERESRRFDDLRKEVTGRLSTLGRLATVGQLAGVLVHEITRGLPVIGDAFQRISGAVASSPNLATSAMRGMDSLRSLQRVVHRFAPYFVGGLRTRRRSSDLGEVIRLAVETRDAQSTAGVAIAIQVPSGIIVRADAGDVLAIMSNVLDNALYWTLRAESSVKQVAISARRAGDSVNVTVSDSGAGISDDDVSRVFEPGFTLKRRGMGLGLSIVRDILLANSGRVDLRGHGPLGGATLLLTLPLEG